MGKRVTKYICEVCGKEFEGKDAKEESCACEKLHPPIKNIVPTYMSGNKFPTGFKVVYEDGSKRNYTNYAVN